METGDEEDMRPQTTTKRGALQAARRFVGKAALTTSELRIERRPAGFSRYRGIERQLWAASRVEPWNRETLSHP